MQGWSKNATYIGVGMLAVGILLIFLGWNGAAGLDFVQGQLPYVISGGIGGLSLVVGGAIILGINSQRRDTQLLANKLDELIDALGGAGLGGPTAVPEGGDHVIAGRTTYHLSSCHLVAGRTDLQVMAPRAAADRGLAPCRICNPGEKSA